MVETEGDFVAGEGAGGVRVIVDRAACIGNGACVGAAPTVFRLDARGRAVLLDPASVDAPTLRRAAARCPTDAIILEDARGEQLYP